MQTNNQTKNRTPWILMFLWARTKQLPNTVRREVKRPSWISQWSKSTRFVVVGRCCCCCRCRSGIVHFFISRVYRRLVRVLSLVLLMYTLEHTLPCLNVYHAIECCNFFWQKIFLFSEPYKAQKENPLNPRYFLWHYSTKTKENASTCVCVFVQRTIVSKR